MDFRVEFQSRMIAHLHFRSCSKNQYLNKMFSETVAVKPLKDPEKLQYFGKSCVDLSQKKRIDWKLS